MIIKYISRGYFTNFIGLSHFVGLQFTTEDNGEHVVCGILQIIDGRE